MQNIIIYTLFSTTFHCKHFKAIVENKITTFQLLLNIESDCITLVVM